MASGQPVVSMGNLAQASNHTSRRNSAVSDVSSKDMVSFQTGGKPIPSCFVRCFFFIFLQNPFYFFMKHVFHVVHSFFLHCSRLTPIHLSYLCSTLCLQLVAHIFWHGETGRGQCSHTASKVNKKNVTTSGPTRTRLTCVRTPDVRGPDVAQHVRGGARKDKRARPNNEAEEAGQVRVNLHEGLDQQGGQANERARPPVLKAVSRESIANSSPQCMSRIMVQRVLVGKRVVLRFHIDEFVAQPTCMSRSEDTESETRQTWWRSACRVEFFPLLTASESCWTRGCDVEVTSCPFLDSFESLGSGVRSDSRRGC